MSYLINAIRGFCMALADSVPGVSGGTIAFVLGFYDKEVYEYIGRETSILTAISMVFGAFIGRILTTFVIKTCELDIMMFNPVVSVKSYLYGFIITIIFTIVVNITTYFALKKIKMVESLKSVE